MSSAAPPDEPLKSSASGTPDDPAADDTALDQPGALTADEDPGSVRVALPPGGDLVAGPWTIPPDSPFPAATSTARVAFGTVDPPRRDGLRRREIVVDGWRFLLDTGSERAARLRARARRGRDVAGHGGPLEVRAIIPGRIVAVSVAEGDTVVAGQQLLVIEAMKMQNELRAPRAGRVERIAVGAGQTVELGVLLLVVR